MLIQIYQIYRNNKKKRQSIDCLFSSAPLGARTLDPGIKSAMLYQLS